MAQCCTYMAAMIIAFIVVLHFHGAQPHPQCVTSWPPMFIGGPMNMCTEYSHYGCCRPDPYEEEDEVIMRYEALQKRVPGPLWSRCSRYIQDFLCQDCSPYAAHMFDTKSSLAGKANFAIPGLCTEYCNEFYRECKDVVSYILPSDPLYEKVRSNLLKLANTSMQNFCEALEPMDYDYCYPLIKTHSLFNRELGEAMKIRTTPGCLCVQEVASGLKNPIIAVNAGDGSNRLFVGEQYGEVHIMFPNGTRSKNLFIDLKSRLLIGDLYADERGLLGMAFHPGFKENGRFFVVYTRQGKRLLTVQLSEFRVSSADPNKADMTTERRILDVQQPWWNHNGGEVLFGSDGYLYMFLGDGGKANDPLHVGQDLSTLMSKAVRIDVNRSSRWKPYAIPPDNPFKYDNNRRRRKEIFSYGLRNPWRCGVDPGDRKTGFGRGRIICGDVGQSSFEELNLIKSGANFGWSGYEGPDCFIKRPDRCRSTARDDRLEMPVYLYNHTVGKCVIGGRFYRGSNIPRLNGQFIYGDLETGLLSRLVYERGTGTWHNKDLHICGPDRCTAPQQSNYHPSILAFGQDEQGEVYILSTILKYNKAPRGTVYRIVDPPAVSG